IFNVSKLILCKHSNDNIYYLYIVKTKKIMMVSQLLFLCILALAIGLFVRNAKKIYRNIKLGKPINRTDNQAERIKQMLLVAFGQQKMFKKPLPAVLHLFVYVGFCIINLEMLEIVIDGLFGTHRIFSFLDGFYSFLIYAFELLAFAVLVCCVIFLIRRNVLHIYRFKGSELNKWPRTDANLILLAEILLMSAFLFMNAADYQLQQ